MSVLSYAPMLGESRTFWKFISSGTGGGLNSATSTINTTGANLIIVAVCYGTSAGTLSDGVNTFTALNAFGGGTILTRFYYSINPTTSSSHTFTYTDTGRAPGMVVASFSGQLSNVLDQSNIGSNSFAVSSIQPGTTTATRNGDLLILSCGIGTPAGATFTSPSGWNQIVCPLVAGTNQGVVFSWFVQNPAAGINPTTSSTSSNLYGATIASFSTR